ncbi:MAG: preprotein translocase subunit SecE [Chloroflexi bacterium]|jgi:preprotein translocase SecE subunit|nr:preprotein translocase subunit SecE [Chloroflexota bacterium]
MPKESRTLAPKKPSRFRFVPETVAELRKAVWPTPREAARLTLMVIAVAASVGVALGGIDYAFTQMVRLLFPVK